MSSKLGIFCLEGDWEYDLRRSTPSVRSLVELIRASGSADAIYRDVGTVEEFTHYCRLWTRQKRYDDYAVGWFAMHGAPGEIKIGRRKLGLDDLTDALGPDSCRSKSLFFSACSTVDVDEEDLKTFRKQIGARFVCGFIENVNWMETAAFELLLMQTLAGYEDRSVSAALRFVRNHYGGLAARLGFTSEPPWAEA